MSCATRHALVFGLLIGVVNLLWLYLAFFLGLHTNGVMIFQVFMLVWFAITVTGFVIGLRRLRRTSTKWSYWKGLTLGCCIAVVTAVVAVVAQFGYFKVVHPEWPEVMAEQARQYFTQRGDSGEELENNVADAREYFTLGNYATQSAIGAFVLGVGISAVAMIFLRRPIAAAAEST